jgi:hypothetical protein
MNDKFMRDCGHWGMFPSGYYVCASNQWGAGGTSYALLVRTDETGKVLDDHPLAPSTYNDMARQFIGRTG